MVAVPAGGGVGQMFMGGIYQADYIKQNGKWKIKKLLFNRTLHFPLGEVWVKPERVAAIDRKKMQQPMEPDLSRTFEPGYPSCYLVPFHFKHPVTGKASTEDRRNATLNIQGNR